MEDLISRRDAITVPILPKEHRKYQTMSLDDAYELGWLDCQECVEDLPSAQLQPCKDAVSKADVLETYAELYDVFDDNKEIKNELHKIYDKINALQAAQPEIIRCRECKHMQKDDIFHQCWCNGNMVKFDDYCSYAERRQDDY